MSYNKVYKSIEKDERETPPELFKLLDDEFHFQLDAAATKENTKCARYIDKHRDSLVTSWKVGPVWCNPPYSRGMIGRFIRHACDQAFIQTELVVLLVPADPSTKWWKEMLKTTFYFEVPLQIRFLNPRVKFLKDGKKMSGGDMRPSALIILAPGTNLALRNTLYWDWERDVYR